MEIPVMWMPIVPGLFAMFMLLIVYNSKKRGMTISPRDFVVGTILALAVIITIDWVW